MRKMRKSERLTQPPSPRFVYRTSSPHATVACVTIVFFSVQSIWDPLTTPCTLTRMFGSYLGGAKFESSGGAVYAAHRRAQQKEPKNSQNCRITRCRAAALAGTVASGAPIVAVDMA